MKEMKNTIKKIASIAMAFTLLGTGTVATKTISPKSDNTLVAQAYIPSQNCNHKDGKGKVHAHEVVLCKYKVKVSSQFTEFREDYCRCCDYCGKRLSEVKTRKTGQVFYAYIPPKY
jgi:hypothetical protein